jgi:hypothetical protein
MHAALDTGALLASMAGATVWIIELALAIFAALMLAWLIFEYKKERNSTHETYEEIH